MLADNALKLSSSKRSIWGLCCFDLMKQRSRKTNCDAGAEFDPLFFDNEGLRTNEDSTATTQTEAGFTTCYSRFA